MNTLQRTAQRVAAVVGRDSRFIRAARPVYEQALSWLAADRGMPWVINGSHFRIDPAQRHRMGQVYDPEVAEFLRTNVRPGHTCLDVGANVGVYALQFARWVGTTGHVVAFEPNPVAARALTTHLRMNDSLDRVRVVEAAVAEVEGVRTFHMADADGMSRLGEPNPNIAAHTRPVDVRVTTVDAFCAAGGLSPDCLLIDVEGFEFAVLSGARQTLARRGRALNVIVEMHPDAWDVAGWSRERAESLLHELGVVPVGLTGQANPLESYGHVLLRRTDA